MTLLHSRSATAANSARTPRNDTRALGPRALQVQGLVEAIDTSPSMRVHQRLANAAHSKELLQVGFSQGFQRILEGACQASAM